MRLHLSLTRAFDPDEFAYLHWTWLVAHGFYPYRDFFFYIIPGFPWLLSPILWLTGESTNFLLASRIFMVFIYGSCAGAVYTMTKKIIDRNLAPNAGMTTALLTTLIFLTFPVTIDKTIDIRPDMAMLLLFFTSAWLILQPEKVRPFEAKILISGMVFGGSVLVLPKILFSLPALMYLLVSHNNFIRPGLALRQAQGKHQGVVFNSLPTWIMGAGIVGLGFVGYLVIHNLIPQAITSITKDSLAVTSGKGSFSPILLLSPYPLIYLSTGGISLPWAVNSGIWMVGIAGLLLLFTLNRHWAVFWGLFVAGNILFVVLFPVPYVQYLLPLSVAGSVLAGYALSVIPDWIRNPVPKKHWIPTFAGMTNPIISILLPFALFISFFIQYRERIAPGANNKEQLQVIRDVLQVTKPDETVYDMVGSYVFRPDGYYICCHPYAEFVHKRDAQGTFDKLSVNQALRLSLRKSLIARQTKFLVMDRVGFVFWKSLDEDKAFLLTNYLPMGNPASPDTPLAKLYSLGQLFRCQQGACMQYDMDGKPAATRSTSTFTIIAPENYTVSVQPTSSSVLIDGKELRDNESIDLGTGIHRFSVSPDTLSFRLQLIR